MQSKAPSLQTERHSEGTQPRRGLGAWVRRGLVWMIAGLLALAVIGAVYQAVATEMDQRAYPPPGKWWLLAVTACTSTALDRAARR